MAKYKAYPAYKDSGVEWLGEIPKHWHCRPLKFLCTCNDQVIPESTGKDKEIECVDIGSVSSNEGITKTECFVFSNAPSRARRLVRDGDIIISTVRTYLEAITPINNPPENMVVSTGFAVIRPLSKLDKRFAAYCLRVSGFIKEVIARSVGVSYPAINASDLINIPIPNCPLDEQLKISYFLNHETAKIDKIIEKQQQLIELLKEKRQAVISHAVTKGLNPDAPMKDSGVEWLGKIPAGWQLSKLRYHFTFGRGLNITKENLQDKGIPCVNYGEIHSKFPFEVDPKIHPLKFVSKKYIKGNFNSLLIKGDIVFADTSEDIEGAGNFTQLVGDIITFAGYHTIIVRPLQRCNSRFYAYLLDCRKVRDQIRHAVKGVKVFSITQSILRALIVWFPSENEQERIAAFLDHETAKIDSLIKNQNKIIELLKEKRQAIISYAVTGKIDVRNWVAPDAQEVKEPEEAIA